MLVAHDARIVLHVVKLTIDADHPKRVLERVRISLDRRGGRAHQDALILGNDDALDVPEIILERHIIHAKTGRARAVPGEAIRFDVELPGRNAGGFCGDVQALDQCAFLSCLAL